MAQEYDLIWVIPNEKGRVGAYEEHRAHPGGRCYVAWDATSDEPPAPVQVALTPFIALRLGLLMLKQVQPEKPKPKPVAQGRIEPKPKPVGEDE